MPHNSLNARDLEKAKYAQEALAKGTCTKPSPIFIADGAKKLYKLEEKRAELIREIAKEWSKVCEVPEHEFWTRAIPQAVYDTLGAYGHETSLLAAEAHLERYGYTITRPTFPPYQD